MSAQLNKTSFVLSILGSGRVTFNNHKSYMEAVGAGFIEIKTLKFTKKVTLYFILME